MLKLKFLRPNPNLAGILPFVKITSTHHGFLNDRLRLRQEGDQWVVDVFTFLVFNDGYFCFLERVRVITICRDKKE